MPLLALENVVARYGEIEALHGLSMTVEPGEIVAVLGANGAGKSTTLRVISGLNRPAAGDILFAGRSIAGLDAEAIVKLGVAHVPEGRRIFPGLSARENIMLRLQSRPHRQIGSGRGSRRDVRAFPRSSAFRRRARLDAVGRPATDGGARPRLLMLDEPSLGLAPVIVQKVFATIGEIRRRGAAVLLVEQNARMALSVADRGYVLETGRLALSGTPEELWRKDDVRAAYLGGMAGT